jgi:hypothetical protein
MWHLLEWQSKICETTWHHIPGDSNFPSHWCENLSQTCMHLVQWDYLVAVEKCDISIVSAHCVSYDLSCLCSFDRKIMEDCWMIVLCVTELILFFCRNTRLMILLTFKASHTALLNHGVQFMFKMWISYVYVCCLVCSCFHSDKTNLGSSLQLWTDWKCQSQKCMIIWM